MDTVSDMPFELHVIKRFPTYSRCKAIVFRNDEKEIWENNLISLQIEENDDVEISFTSEDNEAKLYLDALDIMMFDELIMQDESGRIYREASDEPFVLYKSNAGYDALRVDVFRIAICCFGKWYYGALEVLPKQVSVDEWNMMKDDLEGELVGLAQDIVRRNIGAGNSDVGNLPPKRLYDFFIIHKYANAVLAAMIDITTKPRCEIQTCYEMKPNNQNCIFDKETIKRYVMKAGSEAVYKVPRKITNYDIQDNRILKMIILDYEKRLDGFIELIISFEKYTQSSSASETLQYKKNLEIGLSEFYDNAIKLRKMTSILKSQSWYLNISDMTSPYIPHSLILDTRYNNLYQMYLELKKEQFNIQLDREFSYTWKRSSYMYEIWCFIKICRFLDKEYKMNQEDWRVVFSDKMLFPFLEQGTTIHFENEEIILKMTFDEALPMEKGKTNIETPLYIAKSHNNKIQHNRPDIIIHVYDKKEKWYLGSVVLECKYRKLSAFWNSSERSSLGQLETYYNNARSEYQYGGLGKILQSRPVRKVIVLTPDMTGDGRTGMDYSILVKSFKPSDTDVLVDGIMREINEVIETNITLRDRIKNDGI